jgi:hypothetical protein
MSRLLRLVLRSHPGIDPQRENGTTVNRPVMAASPRDALEPPEPQDPNLTCLQQILKFKDSSPHFAPWNDPG